MLTTVSCVTKTKHKNEILLPPKPERQEIQPPANLKEMCEILIYYEYLVQEWEAWGDAVSELIEN